MKKMVAIGLCMHKILRIIYGMLKNNTPFNPAIDLVNRERVNANSPQEKKDKKRRFQEFDKNAPISRRQKKKREEQRLSQNANDGIEYGICAPTPQSS
jgi:hypothetical protein